MAIKPAWTAGLSFVLLLLVCSGLVSSEVYHIQSSPSDSCPAEPCLTLSQFANNSSNYVSINTTLLFLPGNHSLESELLVTNISMASMISRFTNASSTVITCNHLGRLDIAHVSVVYISGLTFVGCAGNRVDSVDRFTLEESSFIGQEDVSGTALTLVESSACLIKSFLSNNRGSNNHRSIECHDYYYSRSARKVDTWVGGAIVSTSSNVTFIESRFEENSAEVGGVIFSELHSNIIIINTTFIGNHADINTKYVHCPGGGVLYTENGGTVMIRNSHFIQNSANFSSRGGVLAGANNTTITITDSEFTSNSGARGGGVVAAWGATNTTITITDSEFASNSAAGWGGGVVDLSLIHI